MSRHVIGLVVAMELPYTLYVVTLMVVAQSWIVMNAKNAAAPKGLQLWLAAQSVTHKSVKSHPVQIIALWEVLLVV